MTRNEMKQVTFDVLLHNIKRKFGYGGDTSKFKKIYGKPTPLFIFFDNKSGNKYIERIFKIGSIFPDGYFEADSKKSFSDDMDKKMYLAKRIIEKAVYKYSENLEIMKNPRNSSSYQIVDQYVMKFIFFALMVVCADKTDFDQKASMIADFAHMVKINEDVMFDIIQIVKITLGEIELNKIDPKKLDNLSNKSTGYKEIITAFAGHDKTGVVIFKTEEVPRYFKDLILLLKNGKYS